MSTSAVSAKNAAALRWCQPESGRRFARNTAPALSREDIVQLPSN
jgi:hypothetical protein